MNFFDVTIAALYSLNFSLSEISRPNSRTNSRCQDALRMKMCIYKSMKLEKTLNVISLCGSLAKQ